MKWNSKEEIKLAELFFTKIYETKKPYHIGLKKWVKRQSEQGDEAWEIQAERSYRTWLKENNYETQS
jgi:hypothetical protein